MSVVPAESRLPGWFGPVPVKGGNPPLPRGGHTATFIENKLYVFGGNSYKHSTGTKETANLTTIVQDDLHVFDADACTWTKISPKGSCPTPRYAHSATAVGKKLVVFGGFNGKTYLDDVHILDTSSMVWYSPFVKGQIPVARYAHSANLVFVSNSSSSIGGGSPYLFVFGGCGESSVFNELLVLDLSAMAWQSPSNLPAISGQVPPPRAYHTTCIVTVPTTVLSTLLPASDTEPNSSRKPASHGPTTTTIASSKCLVVFGGRAGNKYFNDLYLLNLETFVWLKVPTSGHGPSPRAYHIACALPSVSASSSNSNSTVTGGTKMVIFGGMDGSRCFNETFFLDFSSMKWSLYHHAAPATATLTTSSGNILSPPPPPPPPRHKHTGSLLGSDIWIFAGMEAPPHGYNDLYVLSVPPMPSALPAQQQQSQALYPAGLATTQLSLTIDNPSSSSSSSPLLSSSHSEPSIASSGSRGYKIGVALHSHDLSVDSQQQQQQQQRQPGDWKDKAGGESAARTEGILASGVGSGSGSGSGSGIVSISSLQEELRMCYARLEYLSGQHLEQYSLPELEQLEQHYLQTCLRIQTLKRDKLAEQYRLEYERKIQDLDQQYKKQWTQFLAQQSSNAPDQSNTNITSDDINTVDRNGNVDEKGNGDVLAQLQETVTRLQAENLKLRKRLKEGGVDLMEGVQKAATVAWSSVSTREFLPQQGQGVPSGGAAPLGMDMMPIRENYEPLHIFEKRREQERKGVNRIPEEERISILKAHGVSDQSIMEEARTIDQLNWNRIQSIASPTENPLPETQREMYRRILNQP